MKYYEMDDCDEKELNNELYEMISRGSYSWGVYDYFKENVGGHTACDDLIGINPKLLIYIMAKQINKLSREIDQIRNRDPDNWDRW